MLGQLGAHLGVGQQSRLFGMRPRGARSVGRDGWHPGDLALGRQLPRASVGRDADDDLATGSTVLQPVPVGRSARETLALHSAVSLSSGREKRLVSR